MCRNQAEIARLLLSKGASVNLLNNSMCTALHIAVNKGFTDVVRVLTEHSADVNLQVKHTTRILQKYILLSDPSTSAYEELIKAINHFK